MSSRFQFGMPPVQAIAELNKLSDDIEQAVVGAGNAASVIAFTPTGNIQSTNVQAALAELDTEKARIDTSGNLLVGVTSGTCHTLRKPVVEGSMVAAIDNNTGGSYFYGAQGVGVNTAGTAVLLYKNTTTGRSINAAGTLNATGADYAEYMTKAPGCGTLAKGQIVGVDADGLLVDTWADAVSFLIKSTDPSYVGGDTWGSEEALGRARQVEPVFVPPEYAGAAHPGEDADEAALAVYEADQAAHAQLVAAARATFDTITMPGYQAEMADFEALLEQARQRVDRIAYCGQVPVNVLGAAPGQYVVPVQDGDGIGAQLVDDDAITFAQYRRAVGVVQNLLPDGRANVRVKPV